MKDKILSFLLNKKILGLLVILVIVGVLWRKDIKAKIFPKPSYKTAQAKRQSLMQTVSASGKIEAENQVTLKFQTSGYLTWVGVKKGDQVKKWQAIASLDKEELQKKLKQELIDYMNERWDFEKDRHTYHITTDNLDKYTLEYDIRNLVDKAQFDLDRTVLDVEIQNLALKYATLISPIDGIVTEIESPVAGVNITPTTARFTIADPSVMKFVANVDEADIGQVSLGQKVKITLDTYPEEEIEGEIKKIAFASITTRGGGTAFPTDISLPENLDQKFKVGMNGDAEIIVAQESEVLVVPIAAIGQEKGKKYLKVIEEGTIRKIEVETGIESETEIRIIKGLSEGQVVVTGEESK